MSMAADRPGRAAGIVELRDALARQRMIEDELRRTRDRLAEAQRLARLGSWEWDIPTNTVTWSDELFRIYGCNPGEFEPTYEKFLEHVHPDDRASVDARNHKAFADHQPFDDVKRCRRADGTTFLMRTKGEVITDPEGQPILMLGVCEDVTTELEAEQAQAELASIVESSRDAILTRGVDGTITSWNPGAEELFGYQAEEVLGRKVSMLLPPDLADDEEQKVAMVLAGETLEPYEVRRLRSDGTLVDVSLSMSRVLGRDGQPMGIAQIARDITDRKRFEAQLKALADHDPLTGLVNRRRFVNELSARVAHARHYGTCGAVLLLDLDNFKYVNDVLGHGAGDQLLRSVAGLLATRLRKTDVIGRLGGDEFAVLLPDDDPATAVSVADAIVEAIRNHVLPFDSQPITVTTSIGIACFGPEAEGGEEILAAADRAMYRAKDTGRDRATRLDLDDTEPRSETRLGWEHRIRQALDQDLFVLHCQPILDLATDRVDQYELLLRMRGSDEELILPNAFLGVGERLGLIHAIDRWVVRQAIDILARADGFALEVNLSARSVDDPQIVQLIHDGLTEGGVDPTRLIFEITETAAIGNFEVAAKLASALTDLGCSFALDDFGAGFGSFYYLKHLPADYLKIDGDFVASPRNQTDDLVIDSIVRIAQGLGKRTIAEGVEDASTLAALRSVGVDYAQGFHIGHPFPAEELPGQA
jgi:diguanylate cyclase (GGDEF)-like protein/PAS domain S-box-containing protein